ncbi:phage antirepressor KilAC domain-containing protein [Evansella tamaricis]|uniref:Phage antirepressor KilAC domain-containing protein n=1 Tax=Evansella tamaricis TaxID=2069301 RepID=A0ABS6JFL0_9BACI|nr:phage antirepressor KilAC domain-containing protein [Evansella tamaricis]MBU9711113.1 phage antirepressor KilAC domain-containing protein [Evansella tamaricis]
MNQLIETKENDNKEIIVSARELHNFLEVGTPFRKWFPRMVEYGFIENQDFTSDTFVHPANLQETKDYLLKLDMAKEISMIQRTKKGKQARQYFIHLEKLWNSPEMVMKRALEFANKQVEQLKTENKMYEQQIAEYEPKVTYVDEILKSNDLLLTTQIADDYGMSAIAFNKLLHEHGIQYKMNGQWLLYGKYKGLGYTKSETTSYKKKDGSEGVNLLTKWTQKGRLFLYETLKSKNIFPTMEQLKMEFYLDYKEGVESEQY